MNVINSNTLKPDGSLDYRFHDLPEDIILHVFSFLGSNDIVRLCYVCRKFRKLCIAIPNLSFELPSHSPKCTPDCRKLHKFLNDFLNIHNAPEIHHLRLHWFCPSVKYDAKSSSFRLWVQKAIKNKVQELDIGVPVTAQNSFNLPAGIESLKALKLEFQGGTPKLFNWVFASLEILSLTSVSIPSLEFGEWVSESCKSLRVLNLEKFEDIDTLILTSSSLKVLTIACCNTDKYKGFCYYNYTTSTTCRIIIECPSLEKLAISKCRFACLNLNVDAPSLKGLEISDCGIHGTFDIRISAHKLQTLNLTMQLLNFCQLPGSMNRIYSEQLLCLHDANISLGDNMYEDYANYGLVELIDIVRYARILQLSIQIIEVLVAKDQLSNITFPHLEHLEVTVTKINSLDDLTAIAAFLAQVGCCSPKTLTLRCIGNANEDSDESDNENEVSDESDNENEVSDETDNEVSDETDNEDELSDETDYELYEDEFYDETEIIDQLCRELEKLGVECGNIEITDFEKMCQSS